MPGSGTWVDTVLMRISDVFLAFPGLVFALAVAAALGGGVHNAIIALGCHQLAKIRQSGKK